MLCLGLRWEIGFDWQRHVKSVGDCIIDGKLRPILWKRERLLVVIGFEMETACLVVKDMLEAEVILKSAERVNFKGVEGAVLALMEKS